LRRRLLRKAGIEMDGRNKWNGEKNVVAVPRDVMEKYDREMDKKARDNMERFAEFMARMIEKYGRKVLAEIEKEDAVKSENQLE
jgi:phytoene/squalene synthetase